MLREACLSSLLMCLHIWRSRKDVSTTCSMVEKIGADKFVQIITDNDSSYAMASKKLFIKLFILISWN